MISAKNRSPVGPTRSPVRPDDPRTLGRRWSVAIGRVIMPSEWARWSGPPSFVEEQPDGRSARRKTHHGRGPDPGVRVDRPGRGEAGQAGRRSARAARAALPAEARILDVRWDDPASIIRRARGSDNWPTTWADDGHLYAGYGDGRGFEPLVPAKLSLGFARIAGTPPDFAASTSAPPASRPATGRGAGRPTAC